VTGFILNILSTVPIFLALLAVSAVNTKRSVRVRQTPLPLVALIYLIISLLVFYQFNSTFDSIIESVTETIPLFPQIQGAAWFYVTENLVVITFFLLLKLALRPLFARLFSTDRVILRSGLERIYEFLPEYAMWFVEKRMGNARTLLRALYWTSLVLTILILALARQFPSWPGFESVAFPALATLVVGELYFALNGVTRTEFDQEILGEKDSSRRKGNYGPLRKILADVFPGRVLSDGVHLSSAAALDSGHRLGQLSLSQSDEEQLAGSYFKRLKDQRDPVNVNLVEATVDLLKGSSVLINNPFYVDLTPYLALPTYYNLLKHRKCLIIAGRDDSAEDLVHWMSNGLEAVTGIPDLWNIEMLSPMGSSSLDVGVLRFGDVHNLELLLNNDHFFQNVEFVILAAPSRMIATGQLGLGLLLSRCAKGKTPTYAAFDSNHDGLVDALSHLLKLSLAEVIASALPEGASSEIIWRAEGPHMHSNILPSISRYMGIGTEISAVAMKYQVSRVHWVGADKFPVDDMALIAGHYYSQINLFADLDLSQDALSEALLPTHNPWKLMQKDNYFLIVEDETANAFENIRTFATRAKENGFINLISEDYLLRDYMISNRDLFSADPKAVPSIVSDFARTERNAVLRMILALVTYEMSASELEREFELIGRPVFKFDSTGPASTDWESPVVIELRAAIQEHTGVTDVPIRTSILSDLEIDDSIDEVQEYFSIESGSDLDAIIESLKAAYFFVEDEIEDVNRIGSLLFGHVYQSLLPGQFVTHAGKYYEVQGISTSALRNGVILRRAAEHIRDRRTYRQLRRYSLRNCRVNDGVGATTKIGPIELIRSTADICVESLGYLESPSRASLSQGRKVTISNLPQREYINKSILEIQFPEIAPDVRKSITLMLNELFVSVFPYSYKYVSALTEDHSRVFGDLLDEVITEEEPGSNRLNSSIFIVEDSMVDLGLIVTVERYWERFLEIITEYLAWNLSPEPEAPQVPSKRTIPVFPEREAEDNRNWLQRLKDRVVSTYKAKRKSSEVVASASESENESTEGGSKPREEISVDLAQADSEDPNSSSADLVQDDLSIDVASDPEDGDFNESK